MARYVVTLRATVVDEATGVRTNQQQVYEHVHGLHVQPGPVLIIQNHENKAIAILPIDQIQSCICTEADVEAPEVSKIVKPTLAFDAAKLKAAH